MGIVRTTYLINEDGIIVFANDKVKAATDALTMLGNIKWELLFLQLKIREIINL